MVAPDASRKSRHGLLLVTAVVVLLGSFTCDTRSSGVCGRTGREPGCRRGRLQLEVASGRRRGDGP